MTTILRVFPVLVILLMMTGCAGFPVFRPEKKVSAAAGELLERVNVINSRMTACKGIGAIAFENPAGMPRMKFAWLCSLPDKIRLEVLAPTGQPLMTISSDGTYVYFLPRNETGQVRKRKAVNITLESILPVPLTFSDITHLLAGCIPVRDFDTAERLDDTPDGEYVLELKRRRPDETEHIVFDAAATRPHRIDFFQGDKQEPDYSAVLIGARAIDGTTIPDSLILKNGRDGRAAIITIDRFWTAADVPVEKFILSDSP